MGFWHGANWTFVLWGLYHATFIFIERKLQPLRNAIPWAFKPVITWPLTLGVSMLSWIPFRAENLTDTFELYGRLLNPNTLIGMGLRENTYLIAAMVMASFAFAWGFAHLVLPRLQRSVLLVSSPCHPIHRHGGLDPGVPPAHQSIHLLSILSHAQVG